MIRTDELALYNDYTFSGVYEFTPSSQVVHRVYNSRIEYDNSMLGFSYKGQDTPTHTRAYVEALGKYYFLIKKEYINENLYQYFYVLDCKKDPRFLTDYCWVTNVTLENPGSVFTADVNYPSKIKEKIFTENKNEFFICVAPTGKVDGTTPVMDAALPMVCNSVGLPHNYAMIKQDVLTTSKYAFTASSVDFSGKEFATALRGILNFRLKNKESDDIWEISVDVFQGSLMRATNGNNSQINSTTSDYVKDGESATCKVLASRTDNITCENIDKNKHGDNLYFDVKWEGKDVNYGTITLSGVVNTLIIGEDHEITKSNNGTEYPQTTDETYKIFGAVSGYNTFEFDLNTEQFPNYELMPDWVFFHISEQYASDNKQEPITTHLKTETKTSEYVTDINSVVNQLLTDGLDVVSIFNMFLPYEDTDIDTYKGPKTGRTWKYVKQYRDYKLPIPLYNDYTNTLLALYGNEILINSNNFSFNNIKPNNVNATLVYNMDSSNPTCTIWYDAYGTGQISKTQQVNLKVQTPFYVSALQKWSLSNSQSQAILDQNILEINQNQKLQQQQLDYNQAKGVANGAISSITGAVSGAASGAKGGVVGASIGAVTGALGGAVQIGNAIADHIQGTKQLQEQTSNQIQNAKTNYKLQIANIAGQPNILMGDSLGNLSSVMGYNTISLYSTTYSDFNLVEFLKTYGVNVQAKYEDIKDFFTDKGYIELRMIGVNMFDPFYNLLSSQLKFFYKGKFTVIKPPERFIIDEDSRHIHLNLSLKEISNIEAGRFVSNKLYYYYDENGVNVSTGLPQTTMYKDGDENSSYININPWSFSLSDDTVFSTPGQVYKYVEPPPPPVGSKKFRVGYIVNKTTLKKAISVWVLSEAPDGVNPCRGNVVYTKVEDLNEINEDDDYIFEYDVDKSGKSLQYRCIVLSPACYEMPSVKKVLYIAWYTVIDLGGPLGTGEFALITQQHDNRTTSSFKLRADANYEGCEVICITNLVDVSTSPAKYTTPHLNDGDFNNNTFIAEFANKSKTYETPGAFYFSPVLLRSEGQKKEINPNTSDTMTVTPVKFGVGFSDSPTISLIEDINSIKYYTCNNNQENIPLTSLQAKEIMSYLYNAVQFTNFDAPYDMKNYTSMTLCWQGNLLTFEGGSKKFAAILISTTTDYLFEGQNVFELNSSNTTTDAYLQTNPEGFIYNSGAPLITSQDFKKTTSGAGLPCFLMSLKRDFVLELFDDIMIDA